MKSISCVIFLLISISFAGLTQAQTEWNYISPVPGSKFINTENTIAFRHGDVLDISSIQNAQITVNGSIKGKYDGKIVLSKDKRTLIFYPDQPFQYNETVHVKLASGIMTESEFTLDEARFSFYIKPNGTKDLLKKYYEREYENEMKEMIKPSNTSHTQPEIKSTDANVEGLPIATITEYDNPTPGYIFCGPRPWLSAPYYPHMIILDNYGTPVHFRQWPRRSNDFKVIVNNQLAFCDFDRSNTAINKYIVMDSWFNFIDTLMMGNGYHVDQHDLLMRENGNHFLMAYDPQLVNMDTVVPGGDTAATVVGFIIQELDADHNVIFQWRSWDHFEITDGNHHDYTESTIDYVHGNAFELDYNNTLMMSCRDMEEITKIDLNTGDIIWRLGLHAQNNMFTFINDTIGFSWQHDIRRLDNGNITVYDNGNYHSPKFSQAVEYQIDEVNFTAELVWNYIHDPVVYGRATGANRRLDNNNAFICWGLTWPINYSEVTHEGSLVWELHWPENVWEYRAFKFDWVTDLFEPSKDTLDFGTFTGYTAISRIFTITNNSDQEIQITSTHNHWDSYFVVTQLPLTIPASGQANMTVNFYPNMQGEINDVLTLNYDSFFADTLNQRISRQVVLMGYVEDENPPTVSFDPADGSTLVPQETIINITFDEPVVKIGGETLKENDLDDLIIFRLDDESAEAVPYSAMINAWKTMITITPDTLYPDQNYYLEVKSNMLSDNEGNILTDTSVSHFTTGEEFGIQENILDHVRLYPNPTDGKVYLEVQEYLPKHINVCDMSGRSVFTINKPTDHTIMIDLTNQPAGVYILEMIFEEAEMPVSLKFIKQ